MTDFNTIKRYRDTDPTYTAEDAVIEYLKGHPGEARDIAYQYWDENCPENEPFDQEFAIDNIIGHMSPEDAYWMGVFSEKLTSFGLFRLDGYGHFEAIDDEEEYMLDACKEAVHDIVLYGGYDVSKELQAIIDLFDEDEDDDEDDDYRSNNRKSAPKKKPASKAGAKKPAKSQCVKRSGNADKTPAKKTAQSNNRKPRTTSGKKKAPARRR